MKSACVKPRKSEERGFAVLMVFVLAAVIAITLYMEMPRVAFEAQRTKEQLLIDRANIDPTLRLDLLERVQNVKIGDVNRSLFESLTAAPVQIAKNIPEPAKIKIAFPYQGPQQAAKVVAAAAPPEPAAPPIPLKFYGFINPVRTVGPKRAFFLDGDDIVVANEGQMIKNRYKIVRIGVNSADVEDTQFKKNSRQTLPLVPEEQQS